MKVKKMIRWGILGTAKIAREHLVPAMHAANNSVLQAVASRTQESATKFAEQFNIPHACSSYETLLSRDDIDVVYIPLPTSAHIEWARKALEAGKNVLVEKPLALNAKEILPLIELRDQTGLLATEAFMVTFHPQWIKVKELIASGAIGKLRHVQGAFSYHLVDPDNMRNKLSLGGGGLPDIGVYPTVATRFVTGIEPQRARATIEYDSTFGTDIFASCCLDFDDFTLNFYCATQLAQRQNMVFHGDEGWIDINAPFNAELYDSVVVTLNSQNYGTGQTWRYQKVNQYKLQIEAIANKLRGEDVELFTLEQSLANQMAIDALYASDKSGTWIEL